VPEITPSDQMLLLTETFDRVRQPRRTTPLPEQAPWPRIANIPAMPAIDALPVPGESLFDIAERHNKPIEALVRLPHHAAQSAENDGIARLIAIDAGSPRRTIPGAISPGLSPTAAVAPR